MPIRKNINKLKQHNKLRDKIKQDMNKEQKRIMNKVRKMFKGN